MKRGEFSRSETVGSPLASTIVVRRSETGVILVVDDEEIVLDYVARNILKSGYTVVTAASGEDALRAIKEQDISPQLLVSDLILPGMSGFALADTLRRANPGMKTLLVSSYTSAEYFRQMKVSSPDIPFLQKPFTVDALLQKVQELLAHLQKHTQRDKRV